MRYYKIIWENYLPWFVYLFGYSDCDNVHKVICWWWFSLLHCYIHSDVCSRNATDITMNVAVSFTTSHHVTCRQKMSSVFFSLSDPNYSAWNNESLLLYYEQIKNRRILNAFRKVYILRYVDHVYFCMYDRPFQRLLCKSFQFVEHSAVFQLFQGW